MTAGDARQVLRALLRAVDRSVTSVRGDQQWRRFVLQEFRRWEAEPDGERRAAALHQARDYAFLITSVREHQVGARPHGAAQGGCTP